MPSVITRSVEQVKEELLPEQVEWLKKLATCESNGSSTIKVLDTNSRYSYGVFQWQLESFMSYAKKYKMLTEDATEKDALKIIYDYKFQRDLTIKVLNDGGQNNWFNCSKRLGDYPLANPS
jgi:hypothetical protein